MATIGGYFSRIQEIGAISSRHLINSYFNGSPSVYLSLADGDGLLGAGRYAGMKVEFCLILAMVISGAFAGLTGEEKVMEVHYRSLESLPAGRTRTLRNTCI